MAQAKQAGAQKGARVYVFSTLANDQVYQNWQEGPHDVPIEARGIHIKGGTGVANDRLITPIGVCTEIDEADLEQLEKNAVFKMHQDNGFVVVRKSKADPEKVAADMAQDPSGPRTPSDYQGGGANDVAEPSAGGV